MGLMEDLKVETKVRTCPIFRVMEQLGDEEKKSLQEAFDNPLLTAVFIEDALRKNGFVIAAHVTRHHRNKKCRCYEVSK